LARTAKTSQRRDGFRLQTAGFGFDSVPFLFLKPEVWGLKPPADLLPFGSGSAGVGALAAHLTPPMRPEIPD